MNAFFSEPHGVTIIGCRHAAEGSVHEGCPLGPVDTALDLVQRCVRCPVAAVVSNYVPKEPSA